MNTQPEALRLAIILQTSGWQPTQQEFLEAAAELRRLHEVNQMLVESAEMALEALEKLRFANAPFLDEATKALRQALAQPEQESVKCMYPYCETASGCDGPCSKPLTTPVDAIKITQERVDETAKSEHEPVAYVSDSGSIAVMVAGTDIEDDTPLYTAPPKREWQGLTDEEVNQYVLLADFVRHIEAKLKEKNGG